MYFLTEQNERRFTLYSVIMRFISQQCCNRGSRTSSCVSGGELSLLGSAMHCSIRFSTKGKSSLPAYGLESSTVVAFIIKAMKTGQLLRKKSCFNQERIQNGLLTALQLGGVWAVPQVNLINLTAFRKSCTNSFIRPCFND